MRSPILFACLLLAAPAVAQERFDVFFVAVGSGSYIKSHSPKIHDFPSFAGAETSATAVADLLQRGGAAFGITLVSDRRHFVGRDDIFAALSRVSAEIAAAHARHPLFLFYFTGHGVAEGVAWNHFSIPGNFLYRGDLASLDVSRLAETTLHTGSLVAYLRQLGVPFVVLLDNCYEGAPARFEYRPVPPISPTLAKLNDQFAHAARSFNEMAAAMRKANLFENTYPVLFSTDLGTSVAAVADPRDPDPRAKAIGPLARRALLVVEPALRNHSALSLSSFLNGMTSSTLDPVTHPAITHSRIPANANFALISPAPSERSYERRSGTATIGVTLQQN